MPHLLFYLFAAFAVFGAFGVIINRNPVSSAFSLIACFVSIAALFIGMNAYFIGTIQVLVYTGAIMVLFLFIIMLLDLRAEERRPINLGSALAGLVVGLTFLAMAGAVLVRFPEGGRGMPDLASPSWARGPWARRPPRQPSRGKPSGLRPTMPVGRPTGTTAPMTTSGTPSVTSGRC
jgi:NADH-quinone oxidoreductase subunit J